MKKNLSYLIDIILIMIPFLYGHLVNTMVLPFYPFIMQMVFIVFLCYIGIRFSRWNLSKWKSFLIGNSLWLLSFILFLWQFIILDGNSRNIEIAGLAQNYMLPFVYGTARIFPFINNGTTIMLISYILMLVPFTIGFLFRKNSYKTAV